MKKESVESVESVVSELVEKAAMLTECDIRKLIEEIDKLPNREEQ